MELEYGNILTLLSIIVLSRVFFSKRLRMSQTWQATVTPLASIIGSGFLISAPLLILTTGKWAFLVMGLISVIAFALGSAIRFNILNLEPLLENGVKSTFVTRLEVISRPMLGGAYVVSVTFYLKLLSAFLLRGLGFADPLFENIITTCILSFIGIVGWLRGLNILEVVEKYSVNVKLVIIFSMILGHFVFNANLWLHDQWSLATHSHYSIQETIQKLLGILIIVQGFETSRYLGQVYSSETRIKTMRYAQFLSGTIYILYVGSAMVLFNKIHTITEVAAIDLCRMIAPILPFFLIIAAMMSQFSAAIADTLGSAGLASEATKNKITIKGGIVGVSLIGVGLTWATNIYQIISVASKAFAIYYAVQCLIAMVLSTKIESNLRRYSNVFLFGILLLLMLLVIFFGIPIE